MSAVDRIFTAVSYRIVFCTAELNNGKLRYSFHRYVQILTASTVTHSKFAAFAVNVRWIAVVETSDPPGAGSSVQLFIIRIMLP